MLQNYFKIAFRNLLSNKLFSVINISGMAISTASFFIIGLFVYDELKFDKHIEDLSRKFRVYVELQTKDGRNFPAATIPPPFGPTLTSEYPEVESSVRFLNISSSVLFEVNEKKLTETKGAFADHSVFNMFSMRLREGDLTSALTKPNTVALAKSIAGKYFGNKPAVGQTIEIDNDPYTVSAVYEDFPAQSHLQLSYMLSMSTFANSNPQAMQLWGWQQFVTYIKVKPGTDPALLERKAQEMSAKYFPKKAEGYYYVPHLMPLDKVHLHSMAHQFDIAVKGNAQTVYILSGTAIFILIIAILNFVNLSTARAVSRIKEVGVRKVVGALRSQLIYQFISESVIVAFIALLISGFATEIILPLLNSFTEKSIQTGIFLDPLVIGILLLFTLLIGVVAGAYPAFHISAYKPALILSHRRSGRSGTIFFRKGLVVLQFILSFFLITAAMIVSDQHHFMRTKDMGFEKDNVIVLPLQGEMRKQMESVKNSFLDHPNIISGSLGYGLPGDNYSTTNIRNVATNDQVTVCMLVVDHDYAKTLGLKFIAGRDFSEQYPSDSSEAFIITEATAKTLGYNDPSDALEHQFAWDKWRGGLKQGKVIGVVKDFHVNSLRDNISPIVFHIYPPGYSWIALRVKANDMPSTIDHLQKTWKQFNAEWPFEYKFLDDNFSRMYKSEEKLATLFTFFTAFTIFVACLGLFGLVVYNTSQKYKEISIRKVLGAGEIGLITQLGKNYMLLIGIAFVIAIPFSYYAGYQWLQKFPFRIPLTPIIFIKAGLFILMISLITVTIQSFQAARANPVNALKEQ
jgi:putative ABC transport system permease protein